MQSYNRGDTALLHFVVSPASRYGRNKKWSATIFESCQMACFGDLRLSQNVGKPNLGAPVEADKQRTRQQRQSHLLVNFKCLWKVLEACFTSTSAECRGSAPTASRNRRGRCLQSAKAHKWQPPFRTMLVDPHLKLVGCSRTTLLRVGHAPFSDESHMQPRKTASGFRNQQASPTPSPSRLVQNQPVPAS